MSSGARRSPNAAAEGCGSAAECTTGYTRGGHGQLYGTSKESLHPDVCVVNGTNGFAAWAASVMSVPPWPSAAVTKLVAM